MESMGMASGCGCKEVYRFPHITYLYSLYLLFFAAASLHFVHLKIFLKNINTERSDDHETVINLHYYNINRERIL